MKILLFGQHFSEYVWTLASGMPDQYQCTLMLSRDNFQAEVPSKMRDHPYQFNILTVDMSGPRSIKKFVRGLYFFQRFLRDERPDIVHFQEMPKGFSFVCWLLSRHSKRILTVHDVVPHPGQDAQSSWRQEFMKRHMRETADALIVHGAELATQMADISPHLSGKLNMVPHPAMRTAKAHRDKLSGMNTLLFFGRIARYKGLHVLVQACLRLQERGVFFTLVVAGKGNEFEPNRSSLEAITNKRIYHRHIAPEEIDHLFADADLVVLPYIEASQSGVAAYALGFGKACVATRTGSLGELIKHDFNGLLCSPDDPQQLADCIETMLGNPEIMRQFGRNAHMLATDSLSAANSARMSLQIYSAVLRGQLPSLKGESACSVGQPPK